MFTKRTGGVVMLVGGLLLAACENVAAPAEQVSALSSVPALAVAPGSFGQRVGSFNGVEAFSNGTTAYFSNVKNTTNGYVTGYKWQCVEYVVRYYKVVFGRGIRGGNANTFYADAAVKGLNRAPNGGTNAPRVGNIITSAGGGYGHVAIIRAVGPDYVDVIHQNFSNNASDNSLRLRMTVTTRNGQRYYTVQGFSRSYPIQGWLWPK